MIVLDEPGRIVRERVDDTAGTLVGARLEILGTLHGQRLALFHPLRRRILAGEIAFDIDLAHIVHGRCHRGLDARVQGRGVDGHAAETADTDDADTFRIHQVAIGKEVHGREEVLRVDVRRGHPTGLSAGLTGIGRVEGDGNETSFGHMLRIQAAGLLLHGAERAGDRNCGQFAIGILRHIHVGRQLDAIAVVESDFAVIDQLGLREGLVPFLGKGKCAHILFGIRFTGNQQQGCQGKTEKTFHLRFFLQRYGVSGRVCYRFLSNIYQYRRYLEI